MTRPGFWIGLFVVAFVVAMFCLAGLAERRLDRQERQRRAGRLR